MSQVQVPYFINKGTEAHRGKGTFPIKISPREQRNQGIYQRHSLGRKYSQSPDKWGTPRVVQSQPAHGSSARPPPPPPHLPVPRSALVPLHTLIPSLTHLRWTVPLVLKQLRRWGWFIGEPLLRSLPMVSGPGWNQPSLSEGWSHCLRLQSPLCGFHSLTSVFNILKQYEPHSVLGQRKCPGDPLCSFHPRTYLTPG